MYVCERIYVVFYGLDIKAKWMPFRLIVFKGITYAVLEKEDIDGIIPNLRVSGQNRSDGSVGSAFRDGYPE